MSFLRERFVDQKQSRRSTRSSNETVFCIRYRVRKTRARCENFERQFFSRAIIGSTRRHRGRFDWRCSCRTLSTKYRRNRKDQRSSIGSIDRSSPRSARTTLISARYLLIPSKKGDSLRSTFAPFAYSNLRNCNGGQSCSVQRSSRTPRSMNYWMMGNVISERTSYARTVSNFSLAVFDAKVVILAVIGLDLT